LVQVTDDPRKIWLAISELQSTTGVTGRLSLDNFALGTSGYALIGNGGASSSYQGFLNAGTGGTTRTWTDRLQDEFYAEDYGLVGDGVTDNGPALNIAYTTINGLGGGKLKFPEGNFLFSTQILPQSDVLIEGSGIDVTFWTWGTNFTTNPAANGIQCLTKSNIGFSDLTIVGNGDAVTGNAGTILFSLGSNYYFERIKCTNMGELGVQSQGATNLLVSDCIFSRTNQTQTTFNAYYIDYSTVANGLTTKFVTVTRCHITNGSFFTGNRFLDSEVSHTFSTGCSFGGHIGLSGIGNKILYNTLIDSAQWMDSASTIIEGTEIYGSNHIVHGNHILRNAGVGLNNISNNSIFTSNVCVDNSTFATNYPGIGMISFETLGTPDDCIISNNQSYNTLGAAGTQGYGLLFTKATAPAPDINGTVVNGNNFRTNALGEIDDTGAGSDIQYGAHVRTVPVDNVIPRWDSTFGVLQNSLTEIADDGHLTISGTNVNLGFTLQNIAAGGGTWLVYAGASGGGNPGGFSIFDSSGSSTNAFSLAPTTGNAYIKGSLDLGHTSDTTLSRLSAGVLAVEGNAVITTATGLVGALGSIDNIVARTNGTGGQTLQGSTLVLDDDGLLTQSGTNVNLGLNIQNIAAGGGTWLLYAGASGGGNPGGFSIYDATGSASNVLNLTPTTGAGAIKGNFTPITTNTAALGTTALQWSDLFLAEGGVINWDNGDATLTQTNNAIDVAGVQRLTVVGSGTGYVTLGQLNGATNFAGLAADTSAGEVTAANYLLLSDMTTTILNARNASGVIDFRINNTSAAGITSAALRPNSNDGLTLGTTALQFSDLFLAEGGVINWDNGDVTLTQDSNVITWAGLDSMTFDGGGAIDLSLNVATSNVWKITQSDAGAVGPTLWLNHASASPAISDLVGELAFIGKDSAGNDQQYGGLKAYIGSPTTTAENGTLGFVTVTGGVVADTLGLTGTNLYPVTNDGLILGGTGNQFSDLYLAEGGVINWDNGDATLTQAGNVITLAGAGLRSDSFSFASGVDPNSVYSFCAKSTSAYSPRMLLWNDGSDTTGPIFNANKSRAAGPVQVGDSLGALNFAGLDSGSTSMRNAATITATATAVAATTVDARIDFHVNLAGVSQAPLRITTSEVSFNKPATPRTKDLTSLGTTALQWSDLFLAEGGIINWDNGDATLTQTGNAIVWAGIDTWSVGTSASATVGTLELGAASDTTISRLGAGHIGVEGRRVNAAYTQNYTTDQTLAITQSGAMFTNNGATALVTLTLPASTDGVEYEFWIYDTDGIKVKAAIGEFIWGVAGDVTSSGGYYQATAQGCHLKIRGQGGAIWSVTNKYGTWTVA